MMGIILYHLPLFGYRQANWDVNNDNLCVYDYTSDNSKYRLPGQIRFYFTTPRTFVLHAQQYGLFTGYQCLVVNPADLFRRAKY